MTTQDYIKIKYGFNTGIKESFINIAATNTIYQLLEPNPFRIGFILSSPINKSYQISVNPDPINFPSFVSGGYANFFNNELAQLSIAPMGLYVVDTSVSGYNLYVIEILKY